MPKGRYQILKRFLQVKLISNPPVKRNLVLNDQRDIRTPVESSHKILKLGPVQLSRLKMEVDVVGALPTSSLPVGVPLLQLL